MVNIKTLIEKKLELYSFKDIDVKTLSKLSLSKISLVKQKSIDTLQNIIEKEKDINQLDKLSIYTVDKSIKKLIVNKIKQVISEITSIDKILQCLKNNSNKEIRTVSAFRLKELIKKANSLEILLRIIDCNCTNLAITTLTKEKIKSIISLFSIEEINQFLSYKNKYIQNVALNSIAIKLKDKNNFLYINKYARSNNQHLKEIAIKQYKEYKKNLFGNQSLYDIPIQELYKYDINTINMYFYFLNEELKNELKENKFHIEKQKKLIEIVSLITNKNMRSHEAINIIDTMSYFKNINKNIEFQIIKLLFESNYEMKKFDDFENYSQFVKKFSSLTLNDKLYIYHVMNIKSLNLTFSEKIQGWIQYQKFSSVIIINIIFSSIIFLLIISVLGSKCS